MRVLLFVKDNEEKENVLKNKHTETMVMISSKEFEELMHAANDTKERNCFFMPDVSLLEIDKMVKECF